MDRLTERWFGIILRIVREYYPDARLVAWGPFVDGESTVEDVSGLLRNPASTGARLDLAILDPPDPDPSHIAEMRRALAASELPMESDVRLMEDLTMREREEVLQRGVRFGG